MCSLLVRFDLSIHRDPCTRWTHRASMLASCAVAVEPCVFPGMRCKAAVRLLATVARGFI